MNWNFSSLNKSQGFAFGLGAITVLALGSLLLYGSSLAQAQGNDGAWVLTGQLKAPGGKSIHRFEDKERHVVCYARETDFSGGFSCVVK